MRISDWSSDVCSSDLAKRASRTTRSILLPPSHMAACAFRGGGGPAAPLSSGAKSSKRLKDHRGSRSYAARFQETRLRQVQAAEPLRLGRPAERSEEHTSEPQSLMRISYAVFCLKKKNSQNKNI